MFQLARLALRLTIAASTLSVLAPALSHHTLAAQGIELGATAPGAALETLDGKAVDLKDFIGKTPVVLEFWATWCPNCKALEPAVVAATKKYGAQITFITIAISFNQSLARVQAWSKAHPLPMKVLWDPKANASEAYDAPATSYVVVINKARKVVYTGLGGKQDLDAAIKKAL